MVCPKCGFENTDDAAVCSSCGCCLQESESQTDSFIWSELPSMPVLHTLPGESHDEEEARCSHWLNRRVRKILWQIVLFSLEACILVSVVAGIFVWKDRQHPTIPNSNADNIVYSSDDIVMMLVQQKNDWILEKPENGYNACCFLDLDFDGSPELISISYDETHTVTQMNAFHVRNCRLEKIPVDQWEIEETASFFDIGQQMTLYYAPDTKEMLYLSGDVKTISNTESETDLGCFYLQENRIFQKYYFYSTLNDGVYSYYYYDENGQPVSVFRQEYQIKQNELMNRLMNLHVCYEWVISKDDLMQLSPQKLAALLLRSYDSFSYDTSGLALQ